MTENSEQECVVSLCDAQNLCHLLRYEPDKNRLEIYFGMCEHGMSTYLRKDDSLITVLKSLVEIFDEYESYLSAQIQNV